MKRKILWITLGAALLAVGITAAWTETRSWHGVQSHWWFHRGPMGYVVRELDLSENQRSQIKTIWEGERPNISELVHELAAEQKQMDDLTLQDGAPDDAKIQDVAARQGATLAKLSLEKQKVTGKIFAQVLNPAQRTKATAMFRRFDSHLDRVADWIGNGNPSK